MQLDGYLKNMSHAEARLPNLRNPIGKALKPGPLIGFTGTLK